MQSLQYRARSIKCVRQTTRVKHFMSAQCSMRFSWFAYEWANCLSVGLRRLRRNHHWTSVVEGSGRRVNLKTSQWRSAPLLRHRPSAQVNKLGCFLTFDLHKYIYCGGILYTGDIRWNNFGPPSSQNERLNPPLKTSKGLLSTRRRVCVNQPDFMTIIRLWP